MTRLAYSPPPCPIDNASVIENAPTAIAEAVRSVRDFARSKPPVERVNVSLIFIMLPHYGDEPEY